MERAVMKNSSPQNLDPYRILIVDDSKSFLKEISNLLKSLYANVIVDTARSGEQCLQRAKRLPPDLVLLDIGMDGMNGLVTLRFIKSISPASLVYFLSGHSEEYIHQAVGMVPADGFFTKTQFVEILNSNPTLEQFIKAGRLEK